MPCVTLNHKQDIKMANKQLPLDLKAPSLDGRFDIVRDCQIERASSMHWEGEVCFHDGLAWSTELVPIESKDGLKRWDAKPICLGREAVILPILKGKALIGADINPRRRAVLKGILERSNDDRRDREEENVQAKSTRGQRVIRSGGLRARPTSHAKHGPVNTRHLKAN